MISKTSASEDLGKLLKIDADLNSIHDLDLLLERILLEARTMVGADAGSIYLIEGDRLFIRYSQNDTLQAQLPPGQKLIYSIFSVEVSEHTISGYAAKTGRIVNIPDVYEIAPGTPYSYDANFDRMSGYHSVSNLSVPLKSLDGEILGVLQIINARDGQGSFVPFSPEAESLVAHFANTAVLALQHARMSRAIMLRMIKMSELRDPKETGPHVNRVAGYAAEIYDRYAYRHGIEAREAARYKDALRFAAMLHDVGKVAISDLILKKPGRFTDEEFLIMQGHTWQGAMLFSDPASEYDRMAAEVALTHHQNWDGTGYPGRETINSLGLMHFPLTESRGLIGEEIPLAGRITAVADVFDALVSRRVYKEPWEETKVFEEIHALSGSKFDPDIVAAFFEILPNIEQIRQRYPDDDED